MEATAAIHRKRHIKLWEPQKLQLVFAGTTLGFAVNSGRIAGENASAAEGNGREGITNDGRETHRIPGM